MIVGFAPGARIAVPAAPVTAISFVPSRFESTTATARAEIGGNARSRSKAARSIAREDTPGSTVVAQHGDIDARIAIPVEQRDDFARARPGRTYGRGVERLRPRVEEDSDSIADGYEIGPPVAIDITDREVRAGAEQALGGIAAERAR